MIKTFEAVVRFAKYLERERGELWSSGRFLIYFVRYCGAVGFSSALQSARRQVGRRALSDRLQRRNKSGQLVPIRKIPAWVDCLAPQSAREAVDLVDGFPSSSLWHASRSPRSAYVDKSGESLFIDGSDLDQGPPDGNHAKRGLVAGRRRLVYVSYGHRDDTGGSVVNYPAQRQSERRGLDVVVDDGLSEAARAMREVDEEVSARLNQVSPCKVA